MKIANSFLAGLLLIGSLGAVNSALAEDDGIISKQEFTPGSYCHEKFPAIRSSTLDTDHPTLKSSDTGDVIDYYGPCDESPLGQDQIREQKMDAQDRGRWAQDYED
ncbi:MAG TPA: hypothetical protein VGJ48_26390 [Pyrinomonadaceae bacterium]|jgi:hypothetical protein